MKSKNNIWLLAGALVMVLAFGLLMALNVVAAPLPQAESVTIEVANVMAKPGDLVDITYKVKDNALGFSALDLKIPYDESVYTPETVKAAADLNTAFFVPNIHYAANTMRIAFAAKKNVEGDGLLFTVTYKVADSAPGIGDYPLNIEVVKMQYADALDNFFDLDVTVKEGALIIGIPGDVNGDGLVTPEDAILVLQMLVGLIDWTPRALLWGDVNGDGLVDTTDAAMILRMVVGPPPAKLLYQGHSSIRITTGQKKVIYIDPYADTGYYNLAADLILLTHDHFDHNVVSLIEKKNPDCVIISTAEAISKDGELQTFNPFPGVTIEAVEAENSLHTTKGPLDPDNEALVWAVGYIITIDGIKIYISGDTDKTEQMKTFAERNLDYAFFCCDGIYNMDLDEAIECAKLVNAKHNIPYHILPPPGPPYFDRDRAELFIAPNRLILEPGEEIDL